MPLVFTHTRSIIWGGVGGYSGSPPMEVEDGRQTDELTADTAQASTRFGGICPRRQTVISAGAWKARLPPAPEAENQRFDGICDDAITCDTHHVSTTCPIVPNIWTRGHFEMCPLISLGHVCPPDPGAGSWGRVKRRVQFLQRVSAVMSL